MSPDRPKRVLVLFGTRPEIIKLAPVIRELRLNGFCVTVVSSNQHKQLLKPFLGMLDVEVDFDLHVMRENQGPNDVCFRVISKLDRLLSSENPDMILVQGDTTTTLAGALAGFNRRIPVGHVEAGLRSGNVNSPFPEEMNRRIVSQIATFHFAATEENRQNLLSEGTPEDRIFVTGNPVVDSLDKISRTVILSRKIKKIIDASAGMKRVLLTTHRRESFGVALKNNLRVLRDFVENHEDTCLMFPVHPNPNVQKATKEVLEGVPRVYLLKPLGYRDFIGLMKVAWLIVSDSGGIQEEAPSLGKPLLILRENTERPEAVT
ncbi:MAG: non-hydrolyzing UDP-N-acetylglucosamine 2-epimerase, partial [Pyrinomonadaceae bacterium]